MATILGTAEKNFEELQPGDFIYYIDPKDPTKIKELTVARIYPWDAKPGYTKIDYFVSSDALMLVTEETKHLVPTKTIIAKNKDSRILSLSMPPTIYFTNKRALEKFMGNNLK